MSNPLTIDQMKALQPGQTVWTLAAGTPGDASIYRERVLSVDDEGIKFLGFSKARFSMVGKTWWCYDHKPYPDLEVEK